MEKSVLNNGIKTIIKINKKTPRIAVVLYAKKNKEEKIPGLTYLMSRLMLQGTTNRNSEELANFLDDNAIELITENKADYIRIKMLCLNEDFELGLEVMSDIIFNSTFEEYKKEIIKIKGEFEADLDSPKVRAQDEFYRTLYENHPYGIGRNEIIEKIDTVAKEDLENLYNEFKYKSVKNISFAGDIELEEINKLSEKYFGKLSQKQEGSTRKPVPVPKSERISVIKKDDANQAQIYQGRIFPSVYSKDFAKFILLNTILGASGLSSRLFLELREKQGLAYTVRSVYEPYELGGDFFVYIATEPSNINKSLNGFKIELEKITKEKVSAEELENAKNNAVGKRRFYKETNLLEASLNGYYECIGLGCDFEEKLIADIASVTSEKLMETANEYFSTPGTLTVLAPENNLKESGLI